MCGIYGIAALDDRQPVDASLLKTMGNAIIHRGPDDDGTYAEPTIALGMRRLSIIDLEGGHQPLSNEDDTLWLVCNGEIYNFRELREQLIGRGHRFKTGSDSEVVLHAYEEYGDDFVKHLRGMFGYALWDSKRRRLLLGRDAIGIKPLYYMVRDGRLIFGSEAKSILEALQTAPTIDPDAFSEFLSLGYVASPRSIYEGMAKLPTGAQLIVENGKFSIQRYWSLPSRVDPSISEADWANRVAEQLERSVESQMVSDVPLGAFLSGGIDSSAVVAYMARHSTEPVKTYAIGFAESSGGSYYNELPYAKRVAELFGTEHREIIVEPDVVALLPKLLWHMDEPIADTAFVTTYLVSEFARQDVKVILSGVGGDELFGGYRRYLGEYYGRRYNMLPGWLRRGLILPLARRMPVDRHSPLLNLMRYARSFVESHELPHAQRYRAYVNVFDIAQQASLLRNQSVCGDALHIATQEVDSDDTLLRLLKIDFATQLPDDLLMLTDKMTMATSLECRVPLLDQELVELAATIPTASKIRGRNLKHVLKRALGDVLPRDILYRKKRGFGAPMGAWFKRELAPLLDAVLSRDSIERRGLLNWDAVEQTITMHRTNQADHTDHLLALLNFELWARVSIDRVDPEALAEELRYEVAN